MRNLFKAIIVSFAIGGFLTGCSSTPKDTTSYVKVGKVKQVLYGKHKSEPSVLAVLAGAAVGGLVGNQFGDGSGKDWATAGGAIVGGAITNKALTNRYEDVTYKIYFPEDKTSVSIVTESDANVYRNDIVVVYKNGTNYTFDAYGRYDKNKYNYLTHQLKVNPNSLK